MADDLPGNAPPPPAPTPAEPGPAPDVLEPGAAPDTPRACQPAPPELLAYAIGAPFDMWGYPLTDAEKDRLVAAWDAVLVKRGVRVGGRYAEELAAVGLTAIAALKRVGHGDATEPAATQSDHASGGPKGERQDLLGTFLRGNSAAGGGP